MKRIRQLYFQNPAGELLGLNGEIGIYASKLSGFGFQANASFSDLCDGFFYPSEPDAVPQARIGFTMTLIKEPYTLHQALMDWLFAAGTVTLVYSPVDGQEFCRDIVPSISKGELNKLGWLELPLTAACLTPWYAPTPAALLLDTDLPFENIKRYAFIYDGDLRYGSERASSLSGTVRGTGHCPAALDLTYWGRMVRPRIKLTGDRTGKAYGSCDIDVNLADSECLKFSSRYENSRVMKLCADGREVDLLDALDITKNPFFHVPASEPCTITIEADNILTGKARLQVYSYYRSV